MREPCWTSLFLKHYTPWKRPSLEQFLKNCSSWEGSMMFGGLPPMKWASGWSLERLWGIQRWWGEKSIACPGYTRPGWMGLWATWARERYPYPWQGVGLNDLWRSFSIQILLWFRAFEPFSWGGRTDRDKMWCTDCNFPVPLHYCREKAIGIRRKVKHRKKGGLEWRWF